MPVLINSRILCDFDHCKQSISFLRTRDGDRPTDSLTMTTSSDSNLPAFKPIRLQRFLAQCGLGSRRDCEELIVSGRVEVDGKVASELGTTVDPSRQVVTLDGERLKLERKKYFMLNKPSGFLCTASDPEGRPLVLDLFPQEGPRLFTVGRLDENTTGLLLVTNDGDLAQKLAHPKFRIFRLYRAQIAGTPKLEVYEQLKQGLFFTEGKFRVHAVKPIKKQNNSTWVEVTMTEGHNREVRRLFARVGHKVMKLERIGYGPLRLGRLKLGEFRELTRDELASLHSVLERNQRIDPEVAEKGALRKGKKKAIREPKPELKSPGPSKKKLASRSRLSSEQGAKSSPRQSGNRTQPTSPRTPAKRKPKRR